MNEHNDANNGPDRENQGFLHMLIDTYSSRVPAGFRTLALLVLAGLALVLTAIFVVPLLLR